MVAFWQLLLNLIIRRSHFDSVSSLRILQWPPCPQFSHTIEFWQLSLTDSIRWWHLAAFADFQYSTETFLQLLLPPCHLTHLCSLHSNTVVYWYISQAVFANLSCFAFLCKTGFYEVLSPRRVLERFVPFAVATIK